MEAEAGVRNAEPALEILRSLDPRALAALGRAELARRLAPVLEPLAGPLTPEQTRDISHAAFRVCPTLHALGRSGEALPLLRALLEHARATGNKLLERQASSGLGIHYADVGEVVSAIEHQVDALRLAGGDRLAVARAWNNIGVAMSAAGHAGMATRCHERALNALEGTNAVDVRYAALGNLARGYFETGSYDEGLVAASLALKDEPAVLRREPMMVLRLRRDLVRLLVAVGRAHEAEPHVLDAALLANQIRTPRAAIAAALTRAVYDLAHGEADVGLTRLDSALAAAREVPGALRDALSCVVRAEEMAGHSERALLRLAELSDVVYGPAVAAARQHIELDSIAAGEGTGLPEQEQARARLISKLPAPRRPAAWNALERLAVTACIRVEPSGLHGKRVGALSKALALACGIEPLHALEIGFACEVHDIGMVSVPEEMLRNRPVAAQLQRSIIERHVRAGAEILSDDHHPRIFLAREVVRYHHAHWDGSGYPGQVAGNGIPLAARICAITDAYDDMVCGTMNSSRRSMEEALRHLREEAGRRYDPELVQRFESMIRAESEDLGLDICARAGMDNFLQLVSALQEDRGFV